MTKQTIAQRIAELNTKLAEVKFKWNVAEALGDLWININPHCEECIAAVKDYHKQRVEYLKVNCELNKFKAML